jgi:putative transposase
VVRSRAQLLAENALLRQQLLVLRRSVKRPAVTWADRALLVLLAGRVRAWRQALLLVQPATLLRWHRAGFRSCWRRKSRPGPGRPPLDTETVALIRRLAADNPRWGAERIRGALGKLGLRVAKRTIQTSLRGATAPRPRGQTWAAFLRNHATEVWACDFLPVTDVFFRPLFAFFIIELATRRVVHVGATRHPTDAWVAQQLRGATPFDRHPQYLIRDNDGTFGATFASVAAASGLTILRTPSRAPRANATCERFLGSVRRECLDHVLVLGARHLARVLREDVAYCNRARPHQGLGQALPEPPAGESGRHTGPIRAVPILGGLHHTYRRAAYGGTDAFSAITRVMQVRRMVLPARTSDHHRRIVCEIGTVRVRDHTRRSLPSLHQRPHLVRRHQRPFS